MGRLDAFLDKQIADLYDEWVAETAHANWLSPTEHRIAMFYKWATTAPCDRRRTKRGIQVTGPNFKLFGSFIPESRYLTAEGGPPETECWCFYIEFNSLRKWCYGDTQDDAWRKVIEFLNSESTTNKRVSPL